MRWPFAECLESFEALLKDRAQRSYEVECQMWAALAATGATRHKKPPKPPAILKE